MARTRAGSGAPHAPLRPRRPLALPQPPPPRSGRPPALLGGASGLRPPPRPGVPAARAELRRGPRHAGGGEGGEGTALGTAAAAPSVSLGHFSGLETRRRLPAPAGCNSYLPAPAWSVGRASGGGRAGAPPPCLPRPGARPARLARAPAPRPAAAVRDASSGPRRLSVPGPGRARPGFPETGRRRQKRAGSSPGGGGKPANLGSQARRFPLGVRHRHTARLRQVTTGVWGREGVCGPQGECLVGKPS